MLVVSQSNMSVIVLGITFPFRAEKGSWTIGRVITAYTLLVTMTKASPGPAEFLLDLTGKTCVAWSSSNLCVMHHILAT